MFRFKFRKGSFFLFALILFSLVLFSGCDPSGSNVESWTHTVKAENYTDAGGYSVYRVTEERFNQNDWFDIWMENSFWDPT